MTPKDALAEALFLAITAPNDEKSAAAIELANAFAALCTKRQVADAKRTATARAAALSP